MATEGANVKVLVVDEKSRVRRRLLGQMAKRLKSEYGLKVDLVFADGVNHAQMLLEQCNEGDNASGYGAILVRDGADIDFANVGTLIGCVVIDGFGGVIIGAAANTYYLEAMIELGCTEIVDIRRSTNHLTELVAALTRPPRWALNAA